MVHHPLQPLLQLRKLGGDLRPRRVPRQAPGDEHPHHGAVPLHRAVSPGRGPQLYGVLPTLGQVLPLQQHLSAAADLLQRQDVQPALRRLHQHLPVIPLRQLTPDLQRDAAAVELHGHRRAVPREMPFLKLDHVASLLSLVSPLHAPQPFAARRHATRPGTFFPPCACIAALPCGFLYPPRSFCTFSINFSTFIAFPKNYGILSVFAYITTFSLC